MNIAIDMDETLCRGVGEGSAGEWLPGAADALRALRAEGIQVIVHSCRAHWVDGGGRTAVAESLRSQGFTPVDVRDSWNFHPADPNVIGIWMGAGKPVAYAYVDDRAVPFPPPGHSPDECWPLMARALVLMNPRPRD